MLRDLSQRDIAVVFSVDLLNEDALELEVGRARFQFGECRIDAAATEEQLRVVLVVLAEQCAVHAQLGSPTIRASRIQ